MVGTNILYSDSITNKDDGIHVLVKMVHDGKYDNFNVYRCYAQNDSYLQVESFARYNGKWYVVNDKKFVAALWEAMIPYMDQKGIKYKKGLRY